MKLTRKQKIASFVVFMPIIPFALVLSFLNHFSYLISQILEQFSMKCDRIDRFLSKKYDNFIQSIK